MIRDLPVNYYVVATQSDSPRPEICHHRVVQNPFGVVTPATDHFIPHWPQPGLLKRDASRGERIEHLCFKGARSNLYPGFRSSEFLAQLKDIGVELLYDIKEERADDGG